MKLISIVLGAFVAGMASTAMAQDTLLTVESATGEQVEYTIDDLEALPQVEYVTMNPYIDSPSSFSGPLLRDLVEGVGEDEQLSLVAINDYSVEIPMGDAINYDVIVATRLDGHHMSVREKGPLWVMYPFSDHPELNDSIYNARLIWQLDTIVTP
ncbi:hypothetical protein [Pelagovum pacificum]|uniref:Oxidoreductase molybdopterin-binding domain-containing protein n=1 Tax=Pelagovum pacificum TaxID=2588711 RepID=A0A5C5GAY1_9RHOB|nr:hypothetical protein [Pelagovum pacificum]QQA42034.1 hypothetical protein I8N54_14715 [Pelagovum pacificum]TNY31124.1 hypothetical protein FHY64_13900 [Pelagovum pacificum]